VFVQTAEFSLVNFGQAIANVNQVTPKAGESNSWTECQFQ
jgi:hypothetical protein